MHRGLRTLACVVVVGSGIAVAAHAGPARRLRLPSAPDEIAARIRAEQLLRGGRGPERTLPGRVTDTEVVDVAVTPDGIPRRVTVRQRLRIVKAGDFFVKIPGPVEEAEALPGSTAQPGLRSGSLVWQGFSSGSETLGALVELDPRNETDRLPLRARLRLRVDGRPADVSDLPRGPMDLEVEVTNATAAMTSLPSADPAEPERVARLLDSVRRSLASGRRPAPGRDFPVSIPVASPISRRSARVAAPLTVTLRVAVDRATTDVKGRGTRIEKRRSGVLVTAETVLSADKPRHTFHVSATLPASAPVVSLQVAPSAPPPSDARPPGRGSWTDAYRRGAASGREVLDALVRVLAEAARLPEVDGYLGNPDRDGPTSTTYSYTFVAPTTAREPRAKAPEEPGGSSPWGIAAALAIGVLLLLGLACWWALS